MDAVRRERHRVARLVRGTVDGEHRLRDTRQVVGRRQRDRDVGVRVRRRNRRDRRDRCREVDLHGQARRRRRVPREVHDRSRHLLGRALTAHGRVRRARRRVDTRTVVGTRPVDRDRRVVPTVRVRRRRCRSGQRRRRLVDVDAADRRGSDVAGRVGGRPGHRLRSSLVQSRRTGARDHAGEAVGTAEAHVHVGVVPPVRVRGRRRRPDDRRSGLVDPDRDRGRRAVAGLVGDRLREGREALGRDDLVARARDDARQVVGAGPVDGDRTGRVPAERARRRRGRQCRCGLVDVDPAHRRRTQVVRSISSSTRHRLRRTIRRQRRRTRTRSHTRQRIRTRPRHRHRRVEPTIHIRSRHHTTNRRSRLVDIQRRRSRRRIPRIVHRGTRHRQTRTPQTKPSAATYTTQPPTTNHHT